MSKDTHIFGITAKQLEEAVEKYALLEPLLDEYLTEGERKAYRNEVRTKLGISARTLRRYLRLLRLQGMGGLARKKRRDAGQLRVFSKELLSKARELLEQNSRRSVSMLMKLLEADEQVSEKVKRISPSTLYYHLKKDGYDFKNRGREEGKKSYYKRFEALYPNQLWQGDARHGIPLPHPQDPRKTRMSYLFAWVDDFSRKIMFCKYYWDEKLPRMEDCFRHAVLRWGLPERVYCDNGLVFVSSVFEYLVNSLGIKKIHHPPYQSWCKGKVEAVMKTIKRFQTEARMAGIKTIEELNQTLNAWVEVEYNSKIHSSTGETPNERWRNNLASHPPKRVTDLDRFNSLFLWPEERIINKYGQIQFNNNFYKVRGLAIGETVEIRYDPFDLSEIQVFHKGRFFCTIRAHKLVTPALEKVPEERKKKDVSQETQAYFSKIRQKYLEQKRREAEDVYYYRLKEEKKDEHDGER